MQRRVAITGIGVVAPNGVGIESYWQGLRSGRSGVGPITLFDPTQLPTRIAAEVTDPLPTDLPDHIGSVEVDTRPMKFAVASALEAWRMSGLDLEDRSQPARRALVLGGGSVDRVSRLLGASILRSNPEAAGSPANLDLDAIAADLPNTPEVDYYDGYAMTCIAPALAQLVGARQVWTLSTACAGGGQAIRDGGRIVARGEADWALVGGVDSLITRQMLAGFCQLSAMSMRNDDPQRASRPFDKDRDGFVMGEGGAFLILETVEHARERGATILAELAGAGISSDAYRLTDPRPDGVGMILAMQRAMSDAGLGAEDVQYVNAHGTSTQANDSTETLAIKKVFGEHARSVAVSSTKGMTGHLIHGAGAIEAVCCVLSLMHQVIPPTINHEQPDPGCDLDYVPNEARPTKVEAVLSNSFGFGGQNTTLAFARWTEDL